LEASEQGKEEQEEIYRTRAKKRKWNSRKVAGEMSEYPVDFEAGKLGCD
jgi:hypothetical protein